MQLLFLWYVLLFGWHQNGIRWLKIMFGQAHLARTAVKDSSPHLNENVTGYMAEGYFSNISSRSIEHLVQALPNPTPPPSAVMIFRDPPPPRERTIDARAPTARPAPTDQAPLSSPDFIVADTTWSEEIEEVFCSAEDMTCKDANN